jgi:hypothetical protein
MLNFEMPLSFPSSKPLPASSLALQRTARGCEISTAVLVVPFLQFQSQQRRASVISTAVSVHLLHPMVHKVSGRRRNPATALTLPDCAGVLFASGAASHRFSTAALAVVITSCIFFRRIRLSSAFQHDFNCLSVWSFGWLVSKPCSAVDALVSHPTNDMSFDTTANTGLKHIDLCLSFNHHLIFPPGSLAPFSLRCFSLFDVSVFLTFQSF